MTIGNYNLRLQIKIYSSRYKTNNPTITFILVGDFNSHNENPETIISSYSVT